MNIIEAIKSGRRFRREVWLTSGHLPSSYWSPANDISELNLRAEDILADDWEVEETQVTITRAKLDKAWLDTEDRFINMGVDRRGYFKELLARELGLE